MPDLNTAALSQALLRPAAPIDCSIVEFVGATYNQIGAILAIILIPFERSDLLFSGSRGLVRVVWHLSELLCVDEAVTLTASTVIAGHASTELSGSRRDHLLLKIGHALITGPSAFLSVAFLATLIILETDKEAACNSLHLDHLWLMCLGLGHHSGCLVGRKLVHLSVNFLLDCLFASKSFIVCILWTVGAASLSHNVCNVV